MAESDGPTTVHTVRVGGTDYPFTPLALEPAGRILWGLHSGDLVETARAGMMATALALSEQDHAEVYERLRSNHDRLDSLDLFRAAGDILAATPGVVAITPAPFLLLPSRFTDDEWLRIAAELPPDVSRRAACEAVARWRAEAAV